MTHWLKQNLFRNWFDGLVSVVLIALLGWAAFAVFEWAVLNAVWNADSLDQCNQIIRNRHGVDVSGACWAVLKERSIQLIFGFYPEDLYWRPTLALGLLPFAIAPILFRSLQRVLIWFTACYPVIAYWLIVGGIGLEDVPSAKISGLVLTLVLGIISSAIALMLGILLALARTYGILPVRATIAIFTTFFSQIPVVILFFAGFTILTYLLPPGQWFDSIHRSVFILGLVSAAHISETMRQQICISETKNVAAAVALGFHPIKAFWVVVFPSAYARSLPRIADELARLFRNTAIVSILGFLDPLGLTNSVRAAEAWNGVYFELFVPIAIVFWCISFALTSYGKYLRLRLEWQSTRLPEVYS